MTTTRLYRCSALNANLTVYGCECNIARAGKRDRGNKVRNFELMCCLTCPGVVERSEREKVPANEIDHAMLTPLGRISRGHEESGEVRRRKGRVSGAREGFVRKDARP